jgi:hypothetical protein
MVRLLKHLALLLIAAAPAVAQTTLPTPAPMRWGKSNDANLAAMARPADLATPVPIGPANGQLEAAAVARLLSGKAKDLMRENASQGAGGGAPQ